MSDRPACAYCAKPLRLAPKYVRDRGRAITADDAPPQWGYEGNNSVCSARCGFLVAINLLKCDPSIMQLLPAGWNERHRRSV